MSCPQFPKSEADPPAKSSCMAVDSLKYLEWSVVRVDHNPSENAHIYNIKYNDTLYHPICNVG